MLYIKTQADFESLMQNAARVKIQKWKKVDEWVWAQDNDPYLDINGNYNEYYEYKIEVINQGILLKIQFKNTKPFTPTEEELPPGIEEIDAAEMLQDEVYKYEPKGIEILEKWEKFSGWNSDILKQYPSILWGINTFSTSSTEEQIIEFYREAEIYRHILEQHFSLISFCKTLNSSELDRVNSNDNKCLWYVIARYWAIGILTFIRCLIDNEKDVISLQSILSKSIKLGLVAREDTGEYKKKINDIRKQLKEKYFVNDSVAHINLDDLQNRQFVYQQINASQAKKITKIPNFSSVVGFWEDCFENLVKKFYNQIGIGISNHSFWEISQINYINLISKK